MGKLEKIENDVRALNPEEVEKLSNWLSEYQAALVDQQLEADIRDGKLDALAEEALAAHRAGRSTPL